jgi:hypothetical protein
LSSSNQPIEWNPQKQKFITAKEFRRDPAKTEIYTLPTNRRVFWNPLAGRYQEVSQVKQPKYTFGEAMGLAKYGYTGLYGRGKKKTVGLLGENYQQVQALANYRNSLAIPEFRLDPKSSKEALTDLAAATQLIPGRPQYNSLAQMYTGFVEKYGADASGFVRRYGAMPSKEGKYGVLFDINNRKIRRDDVLGTYQNNLAKTLIDAGKAMTAEGMPEEDKSIGIDLIAAGQDARLASSRSKPNPDKIKMLEEQFSLLGERYIPEVQQSVSAATGVDAAAPSYSKKATSAALAMIAGPIGSIVGNSTAGNDLTNRALDYMSGLAESNMMKGKEVWWKEEEKPEGASWDSKGLLGLYVNFTKGLARFGLGLPAGVFAVGGEAKMAGEESIKAPRQAAAGLVSTSLAVGTLGVVDQDKAKKAIESVIGREERDWGDGVDFQIGDMMWADYARRYYDPFAYEVDENGNFVLDEEGKRKFQGFWSGVTNQDNYDAMGNEIAVDPLAITLDVLDIAPIIGFATKSASVASIGARVPRYGGKMGITRADIVAIEEAQKRVVTAGEAVEAIPAAARESAESIIKKLDENPELVDVLDEDQILEAARVLAPVEEARAAKFEVEVLQRKLDSAPNPRNFRRILRAAINGDPESIRRFDEWKAQGLAFDGIENKWTVRASALFEPRSRVLEKPESVLEGSDKAIIRLPASPIVRGLKEGWYWVGRKTEAMAARELAKPETGRRTAAVLSKWIDMPRFGYRWSYTRAIKNEAIYDWGDNASELYRQSKIMRIEGAANVSVPMRQAIEAEIFGGDGLVGPAIAPQIQRAALKEKLASLMRDKDGNVVPSLRNDEALYQKKLNDLMDREIAKVDTDLAEAAFDEAWESGRQDLKARIANPAYKADDAELDAAMDLYRRLVAQDESISHRLVHEDMTPTTLNHLKQLYAEAMNGLKLTENHLFGKRGRLKKYRDRVLRPNNALALYVTRFVDVDSADEIIAAAQAENRIGTVFDELEPNIKKEREQQLVNAVRALTEDNAGIFRDGLGGAGEIGRPVLILAREQTAGADFVQFHIPRLRHSLDNGKVINGKLVDENEVFTMPKVFFVRGKKGKKAAVVESVEQGQKLLEAGSLNAMADIYPNARFYSEKVAETGQQGVRLNEKMVKTESVIANSAIREHSLAQVIRSQYNYFVSRVERDLGTLAESQAVLIPASQVVGRDPAQSGYRVLHNIRSFDNIEDARIFARQRGVLDEFEQAATLYENGLLDEIDSTLDVPAGMGIRRMPNGEVEFIVRGGVEDWAPYAIDESLEQHSTLAAYRDVMYSDPVDIPDHGFVLAVPNQVDRQLSVLAIEGDDFATRLLSNPMLKGSTNIFKWWVLNFNPKFISNNVLGGLTMMMIHNPAAAPKILMRAAQSIARKNGDTRMSNVVRESEAVNRNLQYEFEHNAYRKDANFRDNTPDSIRDLSNKHEWFRKYIQNFGYTTISAFEEFIRRNVAIDYLRQDPTFNAFMLGDEVADYIRRGIDWDGNVRRGDDAITPFEAATNLLLDRNSPFFNAELKHRMRYTTNTVSGNYHRFSATETFLRNFLMPFYSWQRHSLTYTYRLAVDKPITANVLYNVGQYGYIEAANSGVPDYLMMTVPMPEAIKEMFGITEEDYRIDMNALSPFATVGDMAAAAANLLTGTDLGASVFEFTNPYVNQIIKDTLGVDPRTGRFDFTGEQSGKGFISALYDTAKGIGKGSYLGRGKGLYDAVDREYEADSIANKYAAIDNAADILKNYEAGEDFSEWKLSIPEMRSVQQLAGDPNAAVLNALGISTYRINLDALDESQRAEVVGAYVLNKVNESKLAEQSQQRLNGVLEWQRERDYVYQVWLPIAEQQGLPEEQIRLVLAKIEDQKPKNKKSQKLLEMMGG